MEDGEAEPGEGWGARPGCAGGPGAPEQNVSLPEGQQPGYFVMSRVSVAVGV